MGLWLMQCGWVPKPRRDKANKEDPWLWVSIYMVLENWGREDLSPLSINPFTQPQL